MALRDQPYIPLYVQDYLSDEKLALCTYSTQGIYVRIMCVLHKSETYGGILFKQIPKQNFSSIQYFAFILSKQTGVDTSDMQDAIEELLFFDVLKIEKQNKVDFLFQKRMIKDFNISQARSKSAKKGGGNPLLFKQNAKQTDKQSSKQTDKQNPEYEYEYEYEDVIEIKDEIKEKKSSSKKSTFDFKKSLIEIGVSEKIADDWLRVRKDKKASNTETAFTAIKNQIEISGFSSDDCVRIAAENSWQGLKAEWVKNKIQQNGDSKIHTAGGAYRQNTAGNNAENKKRSVSRLVDMAETILQNS
jgi:hypothetical protein